jgi:hypothetical protein
MPNLPRLPKVVETVVPTDIIEMYCLRCGKRYARNANGLNIDGKTGKCRPCIADPPGLAGLMSKDQCNSTSYRIVRLMEIKAMPLGRINTDLSRKREIH